MFSPRKVINTVVAEPGDSELLISKSDIENDPELIPFASSLKNFSF
jgi:hypothetical protein